MTQPAAATSLMRASTTPSATPGLKQRRKSKAQRKASAALLIAPSPSKHKPQQAHGSAVASSSSSSSSSSTLLQRPASSASTTASAAAPPVATHPSTPLKHSRLALDLPISPLKSLSKDSSSSTTNTNFAHTGGSHGTNGSAMSPLAMQHMQRFHNLHIHTDFALPPSLAAAAAAASSSSTPPSSPKSSIDKRISTTSTTVVPEQQQQPQQPPKHATHTRPQSFRLADFLYKEVFGVHDIKSSDGMHQERVQNFLVVPYNTEQLFLFGVFLALDSFLYVFTYLPMRILFACGCAVTSVSFHTRVFRRTHFYDLMVAVIIAVGTYVLWQIDMSRMYHVIRGQAMIKLYVLFTMIEIFDRLFSSLGQDVLDSLYYTARFQPRRVSRMAMDFGVAIVYVVLHALLLFAQVVTINVAINSSNTSLLTLLISNNFAELKSCVFKKFEEQNLFQIACSDIVERFKLLLIIALILLQSNARDVAYGTTMVMLAEMVIDWLKHAFITKFNQIPPSVYSKFITILCRDLTGWKNEDTILDHTHHVSRRLGLVSLPLACVVLRMVSKALHDGAPLTLASPSGVLVTLAFFLCLAAFKALLSLVLMIYACRSGRLDDTRPKSPRAVRQFESILRYKF